MKRLRLGLVLALVVSFILNVGFAQAGIVNLAVYLTPGSTFSTTPVFSGSGPADSTLVIKIDDEFVGATDTDAGGYWNYQSSPLAVGSHTVQAIWPKNFFAFISNNLDRNISVVETLMDSYVTDFSIDASAILQDVVLTPDHTKAYALDVNPENYGIWPIDVAGYNVPSSSITSDGQMPYAIDVAPNSSKVYVVNRDSSNLSVISTATNTLVAGSPFTLNYGEMSTSPIDIAIEPVDGDFAYIVDDLNGILLKVDLSDYSVTDTVTFEESCYPTGVAFNPTGTTLFVAEICDDGGAFVETINPLTGSSLDYIEVDDVAYPYPQSLAVTPDGNKLLVVNNSGNKVSVIRTSDLTVEVSLNVGLSPTAVAVNNKSTKAYVTNADSDDVTVIDLTTNTIKDLSIAVGDRPTGLGLLEDIYESSIINFNVAATISSPGPTPTSTPVAVYQASSTTTPSPSLTPSPTLKVTPVPTANPDTSTNLDSELDTKIAAKTSISWQKISLWLLLLLITLGIIRAVYKYTREVE